MTLDKYDRENLCYVVEWTYFTTRGHYKVYRFGKSLYVRDRIPERCHYSVKSVDDLTRWIEREPCVKVTQVIPEKDWDKLVTQRRAEKLAAIALRNQPVDPSVHLAEKKAFMKGLPADVARVLGSTQVVNYRAGGTDITHATKKRNRR